MQLNTRRYGTKKQFRDLQIKVYNQHKFKNAIIWYWHCTKTFITPFYDVFVWLALQFHFFFYTAFWKKQTRISGGVRKDNAYLLHCYFGTHFYFLTFLDISIVLNDILLTFVSSFSFYDHLNWNYFVHRFNEFVWNSIKICNRYCCPFYGKMKYNFRNKKKFAGFSPKFNQIRKFEVNFDPSNNTFHSINIWIELLWLIYIIASTMNQNSFSIIINIAFIATTFYAFYFKLSDFEEFFALQ